MNNNSFRYLTLDRNGKQKKIEIQAENTAEARLKLKKQGLIPLKELKSSGKKQLWFALRQRRSPKRKFDVLDFVNRLAPLLAANVPLEKALNVMAESAVNAESAEILQEFRRNLQ